MTTNPHPKPGDEFVGRPGFADGYTATVRYVDEDGVYYSFRVPTTTTVWVGGASHESFHRRYEPKPVITKPHTYPASQAVTMTGSGRYAYLPAITIHPDGTWTVAE